MTAPFRDSGYMRETCYRCFWPKAHCWCPLLRAMETRTRFVFLMHPKEFKQEKAATGRLTRLCLTNSELLMGLSFENSDAVRSLLRDPQNHCVLLYPGRDALNLSTAGASPAFAAMRDTLERRRLVVFLLDATWAGARKMLRLSPSLQALPRIMFMPEAPSRYVIKQQPQEGCLSTLEATHELLTVLARLGLDEYPLPDQLLEIFTKMQDFQLRCAADPSRRGYRRRPFSKPAERIGPRGRSGIRRQNYLKRPVPGQTDTPS
jgi:DTW domain-containing protein